MELHSALKTEEVNSVSADSTQIKLIRLVHGRDRSNLSLHVNPTSFSLSGLQTTGVLSILGFTMSECAFFPSGKCYARAVEDNFNIDEFARVFPPASKALIEVEQLLRSCGLTIGANEGYSYFFGGQSGGRSRRHMARGDGHTSPKTSEPKKKTDNLFNYVFTFIDGGTDRGWATHIWPVNPPLSPEHQAIFKMLEFNIFSECPQNDFNPCWWFFTPYEQRGDSFIDSNANVAHEWFGNLETKFAPAVEKIVLVHKAFVPFNMRVLNIPEIQERSVPEFRDLKVSYKKVDTAKPPEVKAKAVTDYEYDVALSYASEDITFPERLAELLGQRGVKVFFDKRFEVELWGADLYRHFNHIFKTSAKYCIIFASENYSKKIWTNHELKAAQARALEEGEKEYILPVRLDDTEIPGLLPTVKYVDARTTTVEQLAEMVIAKLGKH